jgi:hypothetical protein
MGSLLHEEEAPALADAHNAIQFIARGNVPQRSLPYPRQFRAIFVKRGTRRGDKRLWFGAALAHRASADTLPASIRFVTKSPGVVSMHITAAHVPAIVALIAGILILIMPRLLNFIVAIYLIFVGLIGLGLLRWLHL